jgi:Recombination endonuclease VII
MNADTQRHRRRLYGITDEQFGELYEKQKGQCVICQFREATCVDHDHKTGAIRGLLCAWCNKGLGCFGDNVDSLSKAIEYLITWPLASNEGPEVKQ